MTKFSDLKLDPKVLKAIDEAGYTSPTPIQQGAIPPALEGRDVLGIAQTGTGKTAGFTLPMITLLGRGRARARMPRSLVLCPTRELAAQVAENFDIYAKYTRLTKALLIGGVSFGEQDKLIDRGVDVLIATPGRLLDHFERGKLLLTGVQIMVVDEADRMLDMGFIPDIERIFQLTPFTRQTLFFSATMAPEIERITNTFLHAPERIEVARQATTSETITQRLVELTPTRKDQTAKQKRDLLRALIAAEGENLTNAIVFCNRKVDVDILAKSLSKHGLDAAPIHGDLDQSQRTRTLESFRDGQLRLLIASDVAARGLDIPAVSHVFNYDLPSHAEDYVHRIGRTGRAGRLGTAISIATPADEKYLTAIENLVKATLPRAEAPQGFVVSDRPGGRPDDSEARPGSSKSRRRRGPRHDDRSDATAGPAAQDGTRSDAVKARSGSDNVTDHSVAPSAASTKDEITEHQRSGDGGSRWSENRASDKRRPDGQSDNRPEDRSDPRKDNRGGSRNARGGSDQRGPRIVGMGDHVPNFMLVELRSATYMASSDDAPQVHEDQAADSASQADAAPETKADGKAGGASRSSSRSRSRSSSRSKKNAENDTSSTDDAVRTEAASASAQAASDTGLTSDRARSSDAPEKSGEEAAAKEAAGTETAAAKPSKPATKPRSRSRKPATKAAASTASAETTPDGSAPDMTTAPSETAMGEASADIGPLDQAAPRKTTRTSRSRKASATETTGQGDQPKPPSKPRASTSRKKPATAASKAIADADTSDAGAEATPAAEKPKAVRKPRSTKPKASAGRDGSENPAEATARSGDAERPGESSPQA